MYNKFEQSVKNTLNTYNMISKGDSIIVGVSGGADSVALLVFLCSVRDDLNLTLTAVHVNHGIRGNEAQRDEDFVKSLCAHLDVECDVCKYDIPTICKDEKTSEELAGRKYRYKTFFDVLNQKNANKIAVAHNKNDSVETILIKMTRGCSLNGLRGIAPVNGQIIRPLIEMSRDDIEQYLDAHGISYVTDSTNNENKYTRNIIRNCVIPHLQNINPGFINTVYANAKNIACDDDFIEECASSYYEKCVSVSGENIIVDFSTESEINNAVKKRILIYAYSKLKGDKNDFEQKHIDILINAHSTGKIYNIGNGISVLSEYGKLIFKKDVDEATNSCSINITDVDDKIYNFNNMRIKFELLDNTVMRDKKCVYVDYDKIASSTLTLRTRQDGDKFSPSGMTGIKKLKKFFIDIKLPKSVRDSVPILCADEKIVAVLGYRVDSAYLTCDKTKRMLKISFLGGTNE